jgi:MarR family transcriptional repressor of emrRAB
MSITYTSRVENLVGALSLAVVDDLRAATADAALVQLADHPDITIAELRRRTGLTHSATVRMVAQLELRSLVQRGRTDRDRRAVVLSLTPTGREAAARVLTTRSEALARVLEPLAPEQRDQLEQLLSVVLDALPRDADHATVICRLCELVACPQNRCPVEQNYLRHLDG